MSTLYYFLEANAYLAIFYGFYKILLQKETFYSLNRFYLLGSTALSFLLPFLDVSALRGPIPEHIYVSEVVVPIENTGMEWWQIALRLYLLVVFGLLLRLGTQIYGISKLVKSGEVIAHGKFKEVQIKAKDLSFSFFNYLFINPQLQEQNTIRKHELVHINQRHSLDILFIELVQIANWFNPLISLIKNDIKANHEFIADDIVSGDELGTQDYAMFLIQNSYRSIPQNLSNQMFNQSLLKKRIMKLSQKKSGGAARLKYGLLALLIPGMLGVSAFTISKSYGVLDLMPSEMVYLDTTKKGTAIKPAPKPEIVKVKKNPAKTFPKPTVKNVKFPPPTLVRAKTKKGQKIEEVRIDEHVKEAIIDEAAVSEVKINESVISEVPIDEPVTEVKIIESKKFQQKDNELPPPPPPAKPKAPKSVISIRSIPKAPPAPPARPVTNIRPNKKDVPPPPPPVEPRSKTFKGVPAKEKAKTETIIQGDPISE